MRREICCCEDTDMYHQRMFPRRQISHSWITEPCPPTSQEHAIRALERQRSLTKPQGALGALEEIAITLAGLQRTDRPRAVRVPAVIFAGDHGVTIQGISAYPSGVTVEMLRNFASGGAAISVLARHLGVALTVVDAGTFAKTPVTGVHTDKSRCGTGDFTVAPAMSEGDLSRALGVGRKSVDRVVPQGADLILFGEMGIGNTTSAAAVGAALLSRDPRELVGVGSGLDDSGIERKAVIVARGLAFHALDRGEPATERVLARVGGLEIVALTGAIVTAAQRGIPVVVDGFIVSVAALAAIRLNPSCRPWLIFSHRSSERGHSVVLQALDAKPILDLGLRLGEGSGAAVAIAVIRLACALHNEMATFAEAAVSGPSPPND
jgi:nicotinate-nucleotide--dimethylbenzimidazole phosphoribosyltransferase